MDKRIQTILGSLRTQGVRVSGLATDSRQIAAGEVFLAWPGAKLDGRAHVAEAVSRGAAAVLWERDGFEWNPDWRAPNLAVEGLRDLAGPLAHEVYDRPSEKIWTMGVTGTNGKTSCTQWLAHASTDCGARTAVIGTLGLGFPGETLDATVNTTPDPVLLHKTLATLHAKGAQGVAMEVSSIGLDQGRVNGVHFGVALFTNLSRDHLDYHGDMERYAAAKQKLFTMRGLRHAVLNMDDVQGVGIARQLSGGSVNRAGYSIHPGVASRAGLECWIEAHDIVVTPRGLAFKVRSSWGPGEVRNHALLGRFNVSNLLGVLGTMLVSGVPFDRALAALGHIGPPPGRMQRIGGGALPLVVVDYAHSPDALEQALATLADVAHEGGGRLWCVFGCGGGRDRGKRAMMRSSPMCSPVGTRTPPTLLSPSLIAPAPLRWQSVRPASAMWCCWPARGMRTIRRLAAGDWLSPIWSLRRNACRRARRRCRRRGRHDVRKRSSLGAWRPAQRR